MALAKSRITTTTRILSMLGTTGRINAILAERIGERLATGRNPRHNKGSQVLIRDFSQTCRRQFWCHIHFIAAAAH
jgi:hypothetical protein